MNRVAFLLSSLADQANDVAKAASKAARFGIGNYDPRNGIKNRTKLRVEFCKLMGVVNALKECDVELLNLASNADMNEIRTMAASLYEISVQFGSDSLPEGHIVIEQAEMHDGSGRISQTVVIGNDAEEYERIVHGDEAYPS